MHDQTKERQVDERDQRNEIEDEEKENPRDVCGKGLIALHFSESKSIMVAIKNRIILESG